MGYTYDLTKLQSEALHWIRWRVGDTKSDRPLQQDEEIKAALDRFGITATTDPNDNFAAVGEAAIFVCKTIAAALTGESEIVMTDVGPIKRDAARAYLRLAEQIEKETTRAGTISFANPEEYGVTHVAGVDDLPDLE